MTVAVLLWFPFLFGGMCTDLTPLFLRLRNSKISEALPGSPVSFAVYLLCSSLVSYSSIPSVTRTSLLLFTGIAHGTSSCVFSICIIAKALYFDLLILTIWAFLNLLHIYSNSVLFMPVGRSQIV